MGYIVSNPSRCFVNVVTLVPLSSVSSLSTKTSCIVLCTVSTVVMLLSDITCLSGAKSNAVLIELDMNPVSVFSSNNL